MVNLELGCQFYANFRKNWLFFSGLLWIRKENRQVKMKLGHIFAVGALISLTNGILFAETPAPYPDFTFKRIKPPSPNSDKRITIQIGPSTATPPTDNSATTVLTKPNIGALDWFWGGISPKLEDSKPGRLSEAVAYLDKGPNKQSVPKPRLQHLQDIVKDHGTRILLATIDTKVSPALALAVIGVESSGKSDAVSSAGATGLMQLMPDTATRFGVTDSTDVAQNIKGGVAYLDWLMKEFDNDPILVLAAYNAGENAIKKNNGVPPYAETRDYVPKVLAAWTVARGLCLTPPELISDGCVFALTAVQTGG